MSEADKISKRLKGLSINASKAKLRKSPRQFSLAGYHHDDAKRTARTLYNTVKSLEREERKLFRTTVHRNPSRLSIEDMSYESILKRYNAITRRMCTTLPP